MTEHKLEKYLKKEFIPPTSPASLTPVIISDSKGRYLENQCTTAFEKNIKWWYKSGQTSSQGLAWLKNNLASKIGHLDNISLYVWLGTCDLTSYDRSSKLVSLRPNPEEEVQTVINNFRDIKELLSAYPICKLTFLEIPIFSIFEWNKSHDHPSPNQFKNQDDSLIVNIIEINQQIRQLNNLVHVGSPAFSLDIYHSVACKSKNSRKRPRDLYNFNLYIDGIHPKINLSKVWLRKISNRIRTDCWQ
ncbi:unnamed protein product [Mytilus edulis]|uniref:Uncharacterized protein n=2 Tax=Mytilus TaxID=6548 RepID=A0A8S3UQH8_MYTED|nr:unnamed protein product [Mytilus edulis]